MSLEIVNLGGTKLDARNNTITIQAKRLGGEDDDDSQDLGYVPVWSGSGYAGAPGPDTQGIYDADLGCIIGFRNTQIGSVYGVLKPGDNAMFSTGAAHNIRAFWKEATSEFTVLARLADGNDAYLTLNGDQETFQVSVKGNAIELNEDGCKIMCGKCYIELNASSGHIAINGASVGLGSTPIQPVFVGVTFATGIPSTSVSCSI